MSSEIVTVAMAADSNYVYPTGIAINTLAKSTKASVRLLVAVPRDWKRWVSSDELQMLVELAELNGWEAQIVQCPISAGDLPRTLHISSMTFMKPAIFDIATEETLLFIDGDLIGQAEWTDMKDHIGDSVVAGVSVADMDDFEKVWAPNRPPGWYINAGVLAVKPALWQEQYSACWREHLGRYRELGFKYLEQDIMNACLRGSSSTLPRKFNACPAFGDPIEEASIVHYAGWFKPWLAVPAEVRKLNPHMQDAFNRYSKAERDFSEETEWLLSNASRVTWGKARRRCRGRINWRAHYRFLRWRTARLVKDRVR